MKILAIERPIPLVDWNTVAKEILAHEALRLYHLYLSGQLREHYFNDEKCAVLILECESKEHARVLLDTLPLVKKELISFDVMELGPYTGYDRIIR
ncbi:MAG: hypothetical protein QM743_04010 [Chitinophagaceae bacterium]